MVTTEHMLGETILSTSTPVTASNPELSTAPSSPPNPKLASSPPSNSAPLPSTARNYRQDGERFTARCSAHSHIPIQAHPAVVADYLTECADLRTETGEHAYAMNNTLTR